MSYVNDEGDDDGPNVKYWWRQWQLATDGNTVLRARVAELEGHICQEGEFFQEGRDALVRAEAAEARAEDYEGRYETAHANYMHALNVIDRLEAERDRVLDANALANKRIGELTRLSDTLKAKAWLHESKGGYRLVPADAVVLDREITEEEIIEAITGFHDENDMAASVLALLRERVIDQ